MALSQKHRSSIYQHLTPILGEEEAEALLSHFPARDLDEPVTKEFVRAEIADVRAEIADVRADVAELRGELHTGISGVRGELHTEIAGVRGELHTGLASVRTEIAELRGEMYSGLSSLEARISERFRQQTIWLVSSMAVCIGIVASIGQLFG